MKDPHEASLTTFPFSVLLAFSITNTEVDAFEGFVSSKGNVKDSFDHDLWC